MPPDFVQGSAWKEAVFGLVVLVVAITVSYAVHFVLTRVVRRLAQKTPSTLDDVLIGAVSRPIAIFIVGQGALVALTSTSYLDRWQDYVNRTWVAFALAVVIYGLQRVVGAVFRWYGEEVATRSRSDLGKKFLPFVRRFVSAAIYAIGGLMILDNLGLNLGPLIAGLGITGLAVALGLQPIIRHFFAGAMVITDGFISIGDYIELVGGQKGRVVDIVWRTTRIESDNGDAVIIPNGILVDSIVTKRRSPPMG